MNLEETTFKTNKIIVLYGQNEQGSRPMQLIAKGRYSEV